MLCWARELEESPLFQKMKDRKLSRQLGILMAWLSAEFNSSILQSIADD